MFQPDYLYNQHPQPGQRWRVAYGVYWLHFPLPFALDHVNLWLLDDGDAWVLIDTGYGSAATRELWQMVIEQALDNKPIRRIVVTHFHPDHIGQAAWLAERFSAEVLMTQAEWDTACRVYARTDAEADDSFRGLMAVHGLNSDELKRAVSGGNHYRRNMSDLPPAPRIIGNGSRLTIAGQDWHVHIGRGHAPEHACLYREDDHVLIAGDQVLPRISSNISVAPDEPDADPVTAFVDSLQALKAALPADTLVLPGHGLPFWGLDERVDDLHDHHNEQLDAAEDACRAQRQTACALLPVLFKRKLEGPQIRFAMGEAIAHLNCLRASGRLERECRGGHWTFQPRVAGSVHG